MDGKEKYIRMDKKIHVVDSLRLDDWMLLRYETLSLS